MICDAILAGCIGERLCVWMPKQFHEIESKPLLFIGLEKFIEVKELGLIIVSSPIEYIDKKINVIQEFFDNQHIKVIAEGITRNDNILNLIEYAKEGGADDSSIIVTHDCDRIFVRLNLIKDSIDFALNYVNLVLLFLPQMLYSNQRLKYIYHVFLKGIFGSCTDTSGI